jgi:hypothetical protein
VELEVKTERTSEQGKSTQNEYTNSIYEFKDYMQKMNEKKCWSPKLIVKQDKTLKSMLRESSGDYKVKGSYQG